MRLLKRLLVAFIALAGLLAGVFYVYLQSSLPQIEGAIVLNGPKAPIQIVRDRFGIPHIYAASAEDAQFGLGFVHAQDRLWQMEMNRRVAAGRLSEILGSKPLAFDNSVRTIGLYRAAEKNLPHLDDATKGALEAYAAGVNAFLAGNGTLPIEFLLFGFAPEPWRAADSLAWGKMVSWTLSQNWQTEIARLRLSQKLTAKQIEELLATNPSDAPTSLGSLPGLFRSAGKWPQLALPHSDDRGSAPAGSNNWAVSGRLSRGGKPLLANDPHLELSVPAIWYFAHLSAPGLSVIGATAPGFPGVILGRNDRIAWGFTNTYTDVQDLFLEKIDETGSRYLAPEGFTPFTERQEIIKVRGGDDIKFTVRSTRHGPVISDILEGLDEAPDMVLSLAWVGALADDLTAQAFLKMNFARDWPSFLAAVEDFHSPQQNVVYADVDGNIGFIAPGRVPVRKPENEIMGRTPSPGWDERYDWAGFVPFGLLPRAFNPPSHKIASANNRIVPESYPYLITTEWQEPYRIRRIEELLDAEPQHTPQSFAAMQGDVLSVMARDFLPLMLAPEALNPEAEDIRRKLLDWDGQSGADRIEPLLFQAWYRELTRLVYADELAELFPEYWRMRPVFMHRVLTDQNGAGRWCDEITTTEAETCAEMIQRALVAAIGDLERRYGGNMGRWRWGDAHNAAIAHRPFSRLASDLLRGIFEIRIPTPGDGYTLNVGQHHIGNDQEPFTSTYGASMRAIYDFADLDRSLFIHPTGQSGNVASPLYDNFAERWAAVDYVPMSTRRDAIETGALGRLWLCPNSQACP
jgi:penicillin amidase